MKPDILNRLPEEKKKALTELIRYGVVGVLTTLVNYGVYFLCRFALGGEMSTLERQIAVFVAWIASVAFAYITNRRYVFHTGHVKGRGMWREIGLFFAARVLSWVLDAAFMEVGVGVMGMSDLPVKLISNVLVIIANYFASKLVIFRKK